MKLKRFPHYSPSVSGSLLVLPFIKFLTANNKQLSLFVANLNTTVDDFRRHDAHVPSFSLTDTYSILAPSWCIHEDICSVNIGHPGQKVAYFDVITKMFQPYNWYESPRIGFGDSLKYRRAMSQVPFYQCGLSQIRAYISNPSYCFKTGHNQYRALSNYRALF